MQCSGADETFRFRCNVLVFMQCLSVVVVGVVVYGMFRDGLFGC